MQTEMSLMGMCRKPKPAAEWVLGQIKSVGHAVKVAVQFSGLKQVYLAKSMGISESYFSLIKAGEREFPDRLVDDFCSLTGTLLLREYLQLREALRAVKGAAIDRDAHLVDGLRQVA